MNLFAPEAVVTGAKEALKAILAAGLLWAILAGANGGKKIKAGFFAGLLLALAAALAGFFLPFEAALKPFAPKLSGYAFFIFFLLGIGAFYQRAGVNLFGRLRPLLPVLPLLAFAGSFFYFAPDFAGSVFFLKELGVVKETPASVYASGVAGFLVTASAGFFALSKAVRLRKYMGVAEFLLMLALVKLLLGGVRGFSEFSLIPSVQRGVMKFVHDATHQLLIYFMVPDHPLLKTTVWNFIGVFFGPGLALYIVLVLLLGPPAAQLWRAYISPLPGTGTLSGGMKGSERRAVRAGIRADRRRLSLPVFFFMAAVLFFWFSGKSGEVSALYNPKPAPVVVDKGLIMIPISTPAEDLMDGMIHKFSVMVDEDLAVILIARRPDGRLAVCLDDCEVCPWKGYGQSGGNVVCIYCNTPIPLETLAEPGGCNPIPLKAEITERDVRIDYEELKRLWLKELAKE